MSAGIELTADALVDKLRDNLPAKLDALNAEYADGRTLDHPHAVVLGPRVDSPGYPLVMVIPGAEPVLQGMDRGGIVTFTHQIEVHVDLVEHDEEALTRKTMRYARAVREVALANRRPGAAGGSAGYGMQYVRTDYSLLFNPRETEWRVGQLVGVQFVVQAEQHIP